MVISDKTVIAAEYFSDSLALVELTEAASPSVQSIPFGKPGDLSEIRRGPVLSAVAKLCQLSPGCPSGRTELGPPE
jgi:hypothetical protein